MMLPVTPVTGSIFLLVAILAAGASPVRADAYRVPADPDTVVMVLPDNAGPAADLAAERRALQREPHSPVLAARYAGAALRHYAFTGDPRYAGYADGALQPWLNDAAPPVDIWLLRGRLLQVRHEFSAAARDLDRLLDAQPGNIEALLLSADAWRRSGALAPARRRCLALGLQGQAELGAICAADILMSLGRDEQAVATARAAVTGLSGADTATLAWAQAMLAEAAAAAGDNKLARKSFERALGASETPPLAVELAYVDLLLANGDSQAALQRLEPLPPADAVVLRRLVASGAGPSHAPALHDRLAGKPGPDERHWRERARYALDVLQEPQLALDLARRNWETQKGREDADLLQRAARAAGEPRAAALVADWRASQPGGGA